MTGLLGTARHGRGHEYRDEKQSAYGRRGDNGREEVV
jgi:hypothetical protein